jgi:molecular chaperone HtpG
MSDGGHDRIAFEVETSRILEILAKEIYDSPYALLRENLQNAYDAILMRYPGSPDAVSQGRIDIHIEARTITIQDNGLGMTEKVLRENFWKAGSSGKRTELARQAGVIGTFGIGAMANFGVCTRLTVETRSTESDQTLISTAVKDTLSISKECIGLQRLTDNRPAGTRVIAELEQNLSLSEAHARNYLEPYIRYLPIAVYLNGQLVSQQSYDRQLHDRLKHADCCSKRQVTHGIYKADLEVWLDTSCNVLARLSHISLETTQAVGELFLVQGGGQMMGLRNYFGLAPVPLAGVYQFGGVANLSILQPTAGREALSRESIDHVNRLVAICEAAITEEVAKTDAADRNQAFLQYVLNHGRIELADMVTVRVLPGDSNIALGRLLESCKDKKVYYYQGWDVSILERFSSEQSYLIHLASGPPKRTVQLSYVRDRLRIEEVPDRPTIMKVYPSSELTMEEAAILVRILATLNDDYLMDNVDVAFAEISHGVPYDIVQSNGTVFIYLARNSGAVRPVLECYRTAHEVFGRFVKDFVRSHLYSRFAQFVPSASREGADALYRLLQKNRELYRLEESDLGDFESFLADMISKDTPLSQVLIAARSAAAAQTETVAIAQVGQVEHELPDVVQSPASELASVQGGELEPKPPIMRTDVTCTMKVLLTKAAYRQLNNFEMFLGLSDRLFKREGQFFHYPHTTKVIWAVHRVIYIFTDASGRLTLYYDIELKEPLADQHTASGLMFPTTTIVTSNRIYVPVPSPLESAFTILEGAREFFVRFDILAG